jgi:hypothetical protein
LLAQKVERLPKKPEHCPGMPPVRSPSRWIEGWMNVDEKVTVEMAVVEMAVNRS